MTFSAVLLAGGESTRMGRDKATLEWRGLPLWGCQLQKLRALTSNVFVSARFAVPWRPRDVKLVIDESPSRGPLSGLTAALAMMETDCLLVLAVLPAAAQERERPVATATRVDGAIRIDGRLQEAAWAAATLAGSGA